MDTNDPFYRDRRPGNSIWLIMLLPGIVIGTILGITNLLWGWPP